MFKKIIKTEKFILQKTYPRSSSNIDDGSLKAGRYIKEIYHDDTCDWYYENELKPITEGIKIVNLSKLSERL